jgi:hypothetical protein
VPTAAPTVSSIFTSKPTQFLNDLSSEIEESRRYLEELYLMTDDTPTFAPTPVNASEPTPGPEVETGIGISYNVTIPLERYDTSDAEALYTYLHSQQIAGIYDGNFTLLLQAYAAQYPTVTLFLNGSSSSSDYVYEPFVYVFTGLITPAPTSTPTTSPPTLPPTPPPKVRVEVVAGLIMTSIFLALSYLHSLFNSYMKIPLEEDVEEKELPKKLTEFDLIMQEKNNFKPV